MKTIKPKTYTMELCEGPILKKLMLFCLPLMASNVLQLFFNAADIIVVGQFAGDNSLAAVGSTSSIIHFLTNAFMGLSVGVNVLTARYFAGKQNENLSKTVHTAIIISFICGVIMVGIGLVAARPLLRWMQSPSDVIDLAELYLSIYFLGMPATISYNFGAAILRGVGDTQRPLYYLTFAGIINVVLNCLFIIVFRMDVAGVAIATIISQSISSILVLGTLAKETGAIRLRREYFKIDEKVLGQIIKIGLPAGLQSSLFSLSNVVIQSSINSFGALAIAGNSAATNIEGFLNVVVNAFSQGGVAFVSQNVGAKRYDRINKIVITTQLCVLTAGVVLGNLVYLFGEQLLGLYSNSPEVIESGMKRIAFACTMYAFFGMMDAMVGIIRGLGYSVVPMLVALLGVCVFRIVWIGIMFTNEAFHVIETIYVAYPISWALTFLAHTICFIIIRKKLKKSWGI